MACPDRTVNDKNVWPGRWDEMRGHISRSRQMRAVPFYFLFTVNAKSSVPIYDWRGRGKQLVRHKQPEASKNTEPLSSDRGPRFLERAPVRHQVGAGDVWTTTMRPWRLPLPSASVTPLKMTKANTTAAACHAPESEVFRLCPGMRVAPMKFLNISYPMTRIPPVGPAPPPFHQNRVLATILNPTDPNPPVSKK